MDLVTQDLEPYRSSSLWWHDVWGWGNGSNYQIGTGTDDIYDPPVRVEPLSGQHVQQLFAAKFHSCAVTRDGALYTWGWAQGGRLGHGHVAGRPLDGQAQMTPLRVGGQLGKLRVVEVAAGKHHTVAVVEGGEVFSWGRGGDGRLGLGNDDDV